MTYLPANARTQVIAAVRPVRTAQSPVVVRVLLSVAVDILAIWLAFWLAYLLRYRYELGGEILWFNHRAFSDFHGRIALFTLFCLGILLVRGVYRLSPGLPADEMARLPVRQPLRRAG